MSHKCIEIREYQHDVSAVRGDTGYVFKFSVLPCPTEKGSESPTDPDEI